jgi:hypothetical protein
MWVLARGTHDGICIFSGIPSALFKNHQFESLYQSQIKRGSGSALEPSVRARTLGWLAEDLSITRFVAADHVTHQSLLKLAKAILVFVIGNGETGQVVSLNDKRIATFEYPRNGVVAP